MNSQLKYIVQGVLLTLLLLLTISAIKFIGSISISPSESTISNAEVLQSEPAPISNTSAGQKLFNANCASCHAIYKRLTGPALQGLGQREPWKNRKQLYTWIHNPSSYMKNDSYTKKLYKEYQVLMTPFPNLSNKDIDAIVEYIQSVHNVYSLPAP